VKFYLEKTHHKNRAGGVAQGVGPEIKSHYTHTHTHTHTEREREEKQGIKDT
jgi:hypothetical protein